MKKAILLLFILTSCRTTIVSSTEESYWVNDFKQQAFFNCIKCSYGDSIFKYISKKELFSSYEELSFENINLANMIGQEHCNAISEVAYKFDDFKEGQNYYLSHCLKLFNSKSLDSIAQSEYKKTVR